MKSPEEIKKGLKQCCDTGVGCSGCPYYNDCHDPFDTVISVEEDAIAYIEKLETRLAQVERERDAAVKDCSRFPCATCSDKENGDLCHNCNVRKDTTRTNYEWRGVCEENTKEDADENTEKV